jgi:phosphonate transport system ATP-binding protein
LKQRLEARNCLSNGDSIAIESPLNLTLTNLTAAHPAAPTGVAALRCLSLAIASGEQVAVIGPSGAGKTTLLHVMACAIKPSSGEYLVAHQHPWTLATSALQKLRASLFLAPQVPPLPPRQRVVTAVSAALLPRMSVWQALKNLFIANHAQAAHIALSAFDLGDKLFERVDRLSGGERQRVGLARCIASDAQLLLVDEPLSALDPTRAAQAMTALQAAAARRGASLVCSLHQVDVALGHFPRIIGLRGGELAFDLPASEVTPAVLQALYGDALHELSQAAPPAVDDAVLADYTAPAVMHCR